MAYEGMDFKEWIGEYPVHPVASLFPMIDEPVVIDGRNRHAACKLAGIEPEFKFVMSLNDRELSPQVIADWIISHNLHRRHLTPSQKAAVAVAYEAELAKLAKARQLAALKQNRTEDTVPENLPERTKGEDSRDSAGDLFQVSGRSVSDAKYVSQHDPEAFQRVREGKQAVSAAAKAIREKLNPKPELTPLQKAEREMSKFLKNDEEVIRLGLEIALEYIGEECPWEK